MTFIHRPRFRQKLIQMNLWEGRLYYPLRDYLAEERPDFLTAQELIIALHRGGPAQMNYNDIVDNGLMQTYVYGFGKPHGQIYGQDQHLSVGVFANSELQARKSLNLFSSDEIKNRPGLAYYQLLHATAELSGQTLHLLTYHGRPKVDKTLWHEGRLGTPESEGHFSKIAAYICKLQGPTILAGDFNLWPDAPVLAPLNKRLTNLVTPQHMPTGRNAMAWKADEIVNHVFVSSEVKVEDFTISRAMVSDHQPAVLSFSL